MINAEVLPFNVWPQIRVFGGYEADEVIKSLHRVIRPCFKSFHFNFWRRL